MNSIAQTNQAGAFFDSWSPKSIQITAFDTTVQIAGSPTVTVIIDADSVISKISKYVYGHNAAAWGGKLEQSSTMVNHVKSLAPQVIRWPGGNLSNEYFWKATSKVTCPKDLPPTFTYSDLQYGAATSSWTMPVSSYYDFLSKTNSTGIICVNYSYARYGTSADPVATAAKYAADWVRYDNGRTRYWELGNENFGTWEAGYTIDTQYNKDGQPATISGTLYGKHCRIFIEEMRKAAREVGNDIKIGVVAMDSYVTYNTVMRDWNKGMMKEVAGLADFVIVHSYYTPYAENSGVSTILNSALNTKNYKQYVTDGLKTFASHDPLPVALTEWNIFAEGSGQGTSYINGIHAALILGELIKNQYGEGNRWDFMNGWNNGDTHGLFADGETGISRFTPRAPFFYMYYFQKFFGDRLVHSAVSGSSDVLCYASKFSSGQSGIALVNKGTTDQLVQLSLKGFRCGTRYYSYLLTGDTDNGNFSRKVYVNGITSGDDGWGPSQYAELKPSGTEINSEISVQLPKLSVLYVLVEHDTSLTEQIVSLDSITPKVFGDADFNLTYNSSSGLPVELSSSNPDVAIVTNGHVHITGAGSCDIIASQDGDTSYLPALPVLRRLVVSKGDQFISMDTSIVLTYGMPDSAIQASASSELPLQFTSSNTSVATIINGSLHITGTGYCEITSTQAGNVNYFAAAPVIQKVSILPGEQIIDFPPLPKKIDGEPDFSPGAVSSSGLPCSYTSSNPEVATILEGQIHITGAGNTEITASQEGNNLYNPAGPVTRELSVAEPSAFSKNAYPGEVSISPNPATDYIILKSLPANCTIHLYNALGIEIGSYYCNSPELMLSTTGIGANGLYFIRVQSSVLPFILSR
ncbi:MAG: hypothetical protein U0T82_04105 [Bacteroidales bacterium]